MLISQAHAASEAGHAVPFYLDTSFLVGLAFVTFFVIFGKNLSVLSTQVLMTVLRKSKIRSKKLRAFVKMPRNFSLPMKRSSTKP